MKRVADVGDRAMVREVLQNTLYVGNARDVRSLEIISQHGITAIVDVAAEEPPAMVFRDTIVLRVPLSDDGANRDDHIEIAIVTVMRLLTANERILVACSAGQSRSPMIALAAIGLWRNTTLESELRDWAKLHPGDIGPAFYATVKRVSDRLRKP